MRKRFDDDNCNFDYDICSESLNYSRYFLPKIRRFRAFQCVFEKNISMYRYIKNFINYFKKS